MRLFILLMFISNYSFALDFSKAAKLLDEPSGWVDTGKNNSLEKDNSIFKIKDIKGSRQILTNSEDINIHSHFRKSGAAKLKNYIYSGEMRLIDPEGGGIGVTFYSDYPRSDSYYRLRSLPGSDFFIAPHGTEITDGEVGTNQIPKLKKWYRFKVMVQTKRAKTVIRAKVWRSIKTEPRRWQVKVSDDSETRFKKGKPGIWSMSSGKKQWRNLIVTPVS